MKNKIKLKKYLLFFSFLFFSFFLLFMEIHSYEYRKQMKISNQKMGAIIGSLMERYPDIDQQKVIEIINSKEENIDFLKKYGIHLEKEALLKETDQEYHSFLKWYWIWFGIFFSMLLFFFLQYDFRRGKEIREITNLIQQINKKNYSLSLDSISEDELSILKNEIYKTTVMLKESAENSKQAKRELKKSLEDISHQLKTPLTSILIMLDNLIDHPEMEEKTKKEFIHDIKCEVTNINFLVQAILKLSKFDSNTIHFIKGKYRVEEILQKAVKNVSLLCELKNISIEFKEQKSDFIYCDIHWQVEAITNILKNCIDYSEENSKIIIDYQQNKVYTKVLIQDFGKGISKEDLPHIFQRFYKGKNATRESVGIGLALAKAIIKEDNGSIFVTSNCAGTTFEIKYYR